MQVYKRGDGEPEYTVIGSIHGDEPAGKKAIEGFLEEDREFREAVQFVVANEEALAEKTRFLEADLNRSFPGDPEGSHEERLAAELLKTVKNTTVLDLHTTRSYPLPFATCSDLNDRIRDLLASAGVKNVAYFPGEDGELNEHVDGITVETGFQGTEMAAENALGVIKNFLAAQGVIDGSFGKSDPNIFRQTGTVEGDWRFKAENFKLVKEGEVYAEKDGKQLRADRDFYPVLMSTNGYSGMLGYKAEKLE
jgi:predicted deacylase